MHYLGVKLKIVNNKNMTEGVKRKLLDVGFQKNWVGNIKLVCKKV